GGRDGGAVRQPQLAADDLGDHVRGRFDHVAIGRARLPGGLHPENLRGASDSGSVDGGSRTISQHRRTLARMRSGHGTVSSKATAKFGCAWPVNAPTVLSESISLPHRRDTPASAVPSLVT